MEFVPSPPPASSAGSATEQLLLLAVDAACMLLGLVYSARVLAPKPMTYLSEIAFPADFCVKLAACALLFSLHALEWGYEQMHSSWYLLAQPSGDLQRAVLLLMETLVWGMASIVLWMEYRRGMTPSIFLRALWVLKWGIATYFLVAHQQTWLAFTRPTRDVLSTSAWSPAEVFGGFCYAASGLLTIMCFGASTPISPEFISFPPAINTPSAYLASTHRRPPVSQYGSFQDYVYINWAGAQPPPSPIVPDTIPPKDDDETSDGQRSTLTSIYTIEVSIPTSTTSIWGQNRFVSFKIIVQTDDDVWTVRRHYSDFASLHEQLPEEVQVDCTLPNDESNEDKFMSWRHRPRPLKVQLETYLRQVVNHPRLEPYRCLGLCDFLEMEYMQDPYPGSYRSASRAHVA